MGSFEYGRVHSSTNATKITFFILCIWGSQSWADPIG